MQFTNYATIDLTIVDGSDDADGLKATVTKLATVAGEEHRTAVTAEELARELGRRLAELFNLRDRQIVAAIQMGDGPDTMRVIVTGVNLIVTESAHSVCMQLAEAGLDGTVEWAAVGYDGVHSRRWRLIDGLLRDEVGTITYRAA